MHTFRYVFIGVMLLCIGSFLMATGSDEARKTPASRIDPTIQAAPGGSTGPTQDMEARPPYLSRTSIARSEISAARSEVLALRKRIADMKARGLYDEALWDEYYDALYPYKSHFTRGLDQGGEDCASATVISSLPYTDSSSTAGANDDFDYSGGFGCPWASTSPDVVYQYSPAVAETIDISLCNSYFDTKLIVYEDVCDEYHIYDCDDDGCGFTKGYTSQILDLYVSAADTYYIVVDGYGGDEGSYWLEIDYAVPRPPNDNCDDAIEISCDTTDVYVDLTGATLDCHSICDYPEVWYKFNLDSMTSNYWNVAVSYCGSDTNIGSIGTNLQNDCLCDDYFGYTGVSGSYCYEPSWMPEWIYFEDVPAGDWYLPICTDTGTYVYFDLSCTPTDLDSCPELYCTGSSEEPNDGGCYESPWESQEIACGEVICGTATAYGGTRDTDWYRLTLTSPDPIIVTWDVWSDRPLDMQIFAYSDYCSELLGYADNDVCGEVIVTDPLSAGTYYFAAMHNDLYGVPSATNYRAKLSCAPSTPWSCANPEEEPNGVFPPLQEITLGDHFCGVVASPYDTDLVNLAVPYETAIRIHISSSGQLHPCIEILTEFGDPIAFAGDTLNTADEFTTTFKLGEGTYVLNVRGAAQTTGRYELWVDSEELPKVPPPDPSGLTLYPAGGGRVELNWYGGYFPYEQIRIERCESPFGLYSELVTVPGDCTSYLDTPPYDRAFYRVIAIGERDEDPFVGSTIALSVLDDEGGAEEIMDFVIQEVEWAVDDSNRITMSRFLAQGVAPDDDHWIDADNRNLYGGGLTPIESFSGHKLPVYGREILIDHIAYAQDEDGEIRIVDCFGMDPKSDTTLAFTDFPMWLEPNTGPSRGWGWWWWGWPCGFWSSPCEPIKCCRLKTIAICAATPWAGAFAGVGGPFFPCGPGSPFPPPPEANCPAVPPLANVCTACTLRTEPWLAGWRTWCICPFQPAPPNPMMCQFYIFVKCKKYPCPPLFPPCVCSVKRCPPPNRWVQVPFTNKAMKAACERKCKYRWGLPWWWCWWWFWWGWGD